MSNTSSRRALAAAAALACVGVVGPLAGTTAQAAPEHHRKAAATTRYSVEVVTARPAAAPTEYGTKALGLTNSGQVLGSSFFGGDGFVGRPGRTHRLEPDGAAGTAISPTTGDVFAGHARALYRWKGGVGTPEQKTIEPYFPGEFMGSTDQANARGEILGCAQTHRTGVPFFGTFETVKKYSWPQGGGRCTATGLSDTGIGTVNLGAAIDVPFRIETRAATITKAGVDFLEVPVSQPSAADAISPNGRYIVGRVWKDSTPGPGTVSWLSQDRLPVALPGAPAFVPRVVTDKKVVHGQQWTSGVARAVTWENGRMTDLTTQSRLPAGWTLVDVADVNRRGQLAATAVVDGTNEHVAVLLTPTRR